ncbi:hypothetical protein C0J52_04055 [Blattella germanica]|nr:hypothetical protein C0J52_04055 [Blattella germanica]
MFEGVDKIMETHVKSIRKFGPPPYNTCCGCRFFCFFFNVSCAPSSSCSSKNFSCECRGMQVMTLFSKNIYW